MSEQSKIADRRKQIEAAAEIHLGRINWVTSPRDVTAAFSAGAEWADKTNAEIPPLLQQLAVVREALEHFVKEAVTPDGCGGYFWRDDAIVDAIEFAKSALAETPPPTEGSEDRGK
jgi:hypothetical protein